VSIFLAPPLAVGMRFQVGSTPQPSGDTMPRPVTTTRLISALQPDSPRTTRKPWTLNTARPASSAPRGGVSFSRSFQKFCGVADGQDRLGGNRREFHNQTLLQTPSTSSTVSRLSAPRSSMKLALSTTFSGSTPRCSTTIFLLARQSHSSFKPRACSIGPDPKTIRAIVVVKLSSQSRIVLIWPRHSRQKAPVNDGQAPHRQYTGFQIPAMRSLPVR